MSIIAKFQDTIDHCPLCGSDDFSALPGFVAHAGASFVNELVDDFCESHTGVSPSDFDISIVDPEDLAKNYICHSCGKQFTKAKCVYISFEGEDYQPGDNIEYKIDEVFEVCTGMSIYDCDMDAPIKDFLIYNQFNNLELNLCSVFPTHAREFIFPFDDDEKKSINDLIKFYEDKRAELDEYANLPVIDKLGLREHVEKGKEIVEQVRNNKAVTETMSSAKEFIKRSGMEDDLKIMKKGFFSLFD